MKTNTRVQCTETLHFPHHELDWLRRAGACVLALMTLTPAKGVALAHGLAAFAAPVLETDYPPLLDLPGPDITGEAGVLLHLQDGRVLVEFADELHALEGRSLEVGFGDLDELTLLFEIPADARLFVDEAGAWQTLERAASGVAYQITRDTLGSELCFGVATSEEEAPGETELCVRPLRDDPPPK